MQTSEQIDQIAAALAKAQGELEGASKDKSNTHFQSKYADLESCWGACRKALASNGIAVIQAPVKNERGAVITTRLAHSSGQWIQDEGLFIPADRANAHGYGSAITYCRRYSLCAMVGIAPEDDDGNAANSAPGTLGTGKADKAQPAPVAVPGGGRTARSASGANRPAAPSKPDATPASGPAGWDVNKVQERVLAQQTMENINGIQKWIAEQNVAGKIPSSEIDKLEKAIEAKKQELMAAAS
jgi:hypothetical protein